MFTTPQAAHQCLISILRVYRILAESNEELQCRNRRVSSKFFLFLEISSVCSFWEESKLGLFSDFFDTMVLSLKSSF